LRPAVQPGSRVDDVLPHENVSLSITGSGPIAIKAPGGRVSPSSGQVDFGASLTAPVEIEVALGTGPDVAPRLEVTFHTQDDPRPRALPLSRITLPWARAGVSEPRERPIPSEL